MKKQAHSTRTFNVHGVNHSKSWEFSHHLVPPMTASTTFRLQTLKRGAAGFRSFANGKAKGNRKSEPIWIYDRLEEPSTKMLEEQLALMENGEVAVTFSSGMGAISASFLSLLKAGDRVISHSTLYGCTYSLITSWLPRFHINHKLMNINSLQPIDLSDPNVKVIYFESVSNPSLEIIDIERVTEMVKEQNKKRATDDQIKVIVDNTFATPWGMRPLDHGADLVIQSLTKNIAGFGTEMGGAVITSKKYLNSLLMIRKDIGAIMHPYSAWNIMVYGVSSQIIRYEAQQENAIKVARFLAAHSKVEKVIYPGLKTFPQHQLAHKYLKNPNGEFSPGLMMTFTLKGPTAKTEKFINYIAKNGYCVTLAVSLGLTKTLIEVPGLMTHSAIPKEQQKDCGVPEKLIRLSVGIEDFHDIIDDFEQAFKIV